MTDQTHTPASGPFTVTRHGRQLTVTWTQTYLTAADAQREEATFVAMRDHPTLRYHASLHLVAQPRDSDVTP